MTALKPADVTGHRMVHVRVRHASWSSEPMTPADAEAHAAELAKEVSLRIGDGPALLKFECGDGRVAWIRGADIVSIEHQACTRGPHAVSTEVGQR